MNLSKLLEKLSYTLVSGSVETQVESLTSDSRKVRENTAFVCIVGAVSDGHTYIQAAEKQKAKYTYGKSRNCLQIFPFLRPKTIYISAMICIAIWVREKKEMNKIL